MTNIPKKLKLYGRMVRTADYEILKRVTDILVSQVAVRVPLAVARRQCLKQASIAVRLARLVDYDE